MKIFIYGDYQKWQKEFLRKLLPEEYLTVWDTSLTDNPDYEILIWEGNQKKNTFHELENIVLSPHHGGSFANYDTELLRVEHLARLLNDYYKTGVMTNQVNISKGY